MKKVVAVFLVFFLFSFCGCSCLKNILGIKEKCPCQHPDGAIKKDYGIARELPINQEFDYFVFWFVLATCQKNPSPQDAQLFIEWIKVYKACNNNTVCILNDNYLFKEKINESDGLLYPRSPQWFASGATSPIWNISKDNYRFKISAVETPDNLIHWWTKRIKYDPSCRYYLEMKIKIVGACGLQVGIDFWRGEFSPYTGWSPDCVGVNNCETCWSSWFCSTDNDYKIIRINMDCLLGE